MPKPRKQPDSEPLGIVQLSRVIQRARFDIESLVAFLMEQEYWTSSEQKAMLMEAMKSDARKLAATIRDEHGWRILESVDIECRDGTHKRAYISEDDMTYEQYSQAIEGRMKIGLAYLARAKQLAKNCQERYGTQMRLPGFDPTKES